MIYSTSWAVMEVLFFHFSASTSSNILIIEYYLYVIFLSTIIVYKNNVGTRLAYSATTATKTCIYSQPRLKHCTIPPIPVG
jgi:hypothetical protein